MAKQSQVKCPICEEKFYREDCEYKQVGRRYYHQKCYESQSEDIRLTQEIHEKMRSLLKDAYIKQKIDKQIKSYLEENKTLKGIKLTLDYWYDIKKNDPTKAMGGIGIVGYIYKEAQSYWTKKEERVNCNKDIDLSCYDKIQTYQIKPSPIKKPKRVKLFNLD